MPPVVRLQAERRAARALAQIIGLEELAEDLERIARRHAEPAVEDGAAPGRVELQVDDQRVVDRERAVARLVEPQVLEADGRAELAQHLLEFSSSGIACSRALSALLVDHGRPS